MATSKRQIVLAVDAGAPAQSAFQWALDNLIKEGDHLALVNVRHAKGIALPTVPDHATSTGSDGDNDEGYTLAVNQIMDKMVKEMHDKGIKAPVDRVIKSGDPKKVLLDEVIIRDAAALVLGSRGQDTVHRAIMGSVSDHCAHHANAAVIIVREKQ